MPAIPDVWHVGRDVVLGAGVKEFFSTGALRGRNSLQHLAQVPPASVELRGRDGAIEYPPSVLIDQVTKGQESNLRMFRDKFRP